MTVSACDLPIIANGGDADIAGFDIVSVILRIP